MSIEPHRSAPVGVSPRDDLPGLATAFDEGAMKGHLQAAIFGPDHPAYRVERCTPTRPLYTPGESCVVRYRVKARDVTTGTILERIVTGRVFPTRSACASYVTERLAPLMERTRSRPDLAAFVAPAATIHPLKMAVHVWPVDGELPALLDVTDRATVLGVLRDTLPEAVDQRLLVRDCRIELVSYRRRGRCVLRYTVTGATAGSHENRTLVLYGKVTASPDEALNAYVVDALRDRIREPAARSRFTVPRSLGVRPELGLALVEAIPGEARIGPALKARSGGRPAPDGARLEEMVATCGGVASMLHGSGLSAGRPRRLDDDLAGLQALVSSARRFVPGFADRAASSLERITALGERSGPLEPCLSHGDFKHEQVLFAGAGSGLVDFDGICQAEPALDLGKFVAHLRFEAEKLRRRASMWSALGDELAETFLEAYVETSRGRVDDERRLRFRTILYEAVALLRLALRSQHDLDEPRAEMTAALLERRLSALAAEQPVTPRRT